MKIRSILFILGVTFSQFSLAQQTLPRDPDCCTSIMVGKLASTDGSVMTSHTCDSWYRTWVNVVPAADFATTDVTADIHFSTGLCEREVRRTKTDFSFRAERLRFPDQR